MSKKSLGILLIVVGAIMNRIPAFFGQQIYNAFGSSVTMLFSILRYGSLAVIAFGIVTLVRISTKNPQKQGVSAKTLWMIAAIIFVVGLVDVVGSVGLIQNGFNVHRADLYTGFLTFIVGSKPYSSAIIAGVIWIAVAAGFAIAGFVAKKRTPQNVAMADGVQNNGFAFAQAKESGEKIVATSAQAYTSYDKRVQALRQTSVHIHEMTEAKLFSMSVFELVLRSPASAKFAPLEEISCVMENDVYVVSGYVDSQNAYGAMVRTQFSNKVKKINGTWQVFAAKPKITGKAVGISLMISSAFVDVMAMVMLSVLPEAFTPLIIFGAVMFLVGLIMTITSRK